MIVKFVTDSGPSTLVVPARTVPVRVVSSSTETTSSASVKPSATGVTPIVRLEVSVVTPSVTVYVATGTGPL